MHARGIPRLRGHADGPAAAEFSNRIVLHVDKDFELIADLTGQPLERLTT
jgi:hypothetical protein